MGVTLERVQFKFASIIGELCSEPDILSQFAVWVDLRLAEYKLKGSISLDCSGETPDPMWLKGILSALLAKRMAEENAAMKLPSRGSFWNHGPLVQSVPALHNRLSTNQGREVHNSDVFPVGLHLHKGAGVGNCQKDRKRRASETIVRSEYMHSQDVTKQRRYGGKEADSSTLPNESLMSIISAGEGFTDSHSSAVSKENNKTCDNIKTETVVELHAESNAPDVRSPPESSGLSSEMEHSGTLPDDLRGLADLDPCGKPSTTQRWETSTGSKNAACAAGILQRWLQNRELPELRRIEEISPVELDAYLLKFFGSITKTNGRDYDHRSWRNLRSNIDRYLREHGYAHAISHSSLFHKSRAVFLQRQESLKVAAALSRSNSSPKEQSTVDMPQKSQPWPPILHRTAPKPTDSPIGSLVMDNNIQQNA